MPGFPQLTWTEITWDHTYTCSSLQNSAAILLRALGSLCLTSSPGDSYLWQGLETVTYSAKSVWLSQLGSEVMDDFGMLRTVQSPCPLQLEQFFYLFYLFIFHFLSFVR